MGREQLECFPGHGDGAEPFGENQGKTDLFRACDGHAKVVAQECAQILIMNAANNQARHPHLFRASQRIRRDEGAAHNDLALHVSR